MDEDEQEAGAQPLDEDMGDFGGMGGMGGMGGGMDFGGMDMEKVRHSSICQL